MKYILCLFCFLLPLNSSCNHSGRRTAVITNSQTLSPGQARITLYLETLGESGDVVDFRLLSVELKGRGDWQSLQLDKIRISRRELGQRQLLLGVASLPTDTYTELHLNVAEVKKNGAELLASGSERQLLIKLVSPLVLNSEVSSCLFIEWHNLASNVARGDFFSSFRARPQGRPQVSDLVTVLCRDLSTVYQISPDQNRVVAALGLPEKIGEIAFASRQRRFYAVATGVRALLKYDAVTNRLLDTIALPQAVAPESLVLSQDGRYAFVSDTSANLISKIDLENGFVEAATRKHLRPGRLFFFAGLKRDLLAVLAPTESAVYLLDPESLQTLFILPVTGRPAGIARAGDYLYVSDIYSDKVALYSLKNGRLLALIRVGRAPFDLVTVKGRVYVSVSEETYLSLLLPPQQTPTRRIRCRFRPQTLALSQNWQKLYAANFRPDQLEVIDLQSGTGLGIIPLPGAPDQIVLWESR